MSEIDFRRSRTGRRRSWFGAKRYIKRFLSYEPFHFFVRLAARMVPSLNTAGRLPAPAHVHEVVGLVLDKRFVMTDPSRCVVAKELYWGKGRRPQPQDDFAINLFACLAATADVALDVGAYTGIFTLVACAANPTIQVHAFEIVPEVFKALVDNCAKNDVLCRTTLHHVGIGDPNFVFVVPAESRESALPSFYSGRLHFDSGVRIRFESLDFMMPLLGQGKRVLIKVDVEGTEAEVLRHGADFLAAYRPDFLCEVLADLADPEALMALLEPHGYRYYLVGAGELIPSTTVVPHHQYRDWLFTTRDEAEMRTLVQSARAARPSVR